MNKRISTVWTSAIRIAVVVSTALLQSAYAQDAGRGNGQPPERGPKAKSCNTILEITETVPADSTYVGHLEKGQRFRFIGPVADENHMIVAPVAGGSGPPHAVVAGNHQAFRVSTGSSLPWVYEWAAPVLSPGKHDAVRIHMYTMSVTEVGQGSNQGCPAKVEFEIGAHAFSIGDLDPGHATAN